MADERSSLTTLRLQEYSTPTANGRLLLAQFTDREVIVYQAYKPEIGMFAAEHNYFGGGFSFARTSWIKPNFTWMMHRCGWATKQHQEMVLALSLRRDFWDDVLSHAVMSNYAAHLSTLPEGADPPTAPREEGQNRWKASLRASNVVMQWDPDHQPFTGHKTNHRVIQLGLRGDTLAAFRGTAFGEGGIQDITPFVRTTDERHQADGESVGALFLPAEEPYPVENAQVAQRIGIAYIG
eukprot:g9575.t1